jgi:hypothetical protein
VLILYLFSVVGFNIAVKCYNLGMTVVAGCLNLKSEGALKLNDLDKEFRVHLCEIDITMCEKIYQAYKIVSAIIDENEDYGNISFKEVIYNLYVILLIVSLQSSRHLLTTPAS